ncbi:uncharacterized protein LOC100376606 [Saccoglossus kowalevskii]
MSFDGEGSCVCAPGFRGPRCENRTGGYNCTAIPCLNGGTCLMTTGGFGRCMCTPGFMGLRCENGTGNNSCVPNPCLNGANCRPATWNHGANAAPYYCACPSNFYGTNCEHQMVSECASMPCLNGGSCESLQWAGDMPVDRRYRCHCAMGFTGQHCEQPSDITSCNGTSCLNGGVCVMSFDGEGSCVCAPGFRGPRCENRTGGYNCTAIPCLNGGTCLMTTGGFGRCMCTPGFMGLRCENGTGDNSCVPNPCLNGATCRPASWNHGANAAPYYCACPSNFYGTNCEHQMVSECASMPCLNGGSCESLPWADDMPVDRRYRCHCAMGFTGQHCEQPSGANPCVPDPCLNGASCRPAPGNYGTNTGPYYCACPSNFYGANCEHQMVSECASMPCLNGGTCESLPWADDMPVDRRYRCQCTTHFTGHLCGTPVDQITCSHAGKVYGEGETMPSDDNCNTCTCQHGMRACTEMYCGCPNGQTPVNCLVDPCVGVLCGDDPDAECRANYCGRCNAEFYDKNGDKIDCEAKRSCKYEEQIYPHGAPMGFSSPNDCNTCVCSNGVRSCTNIFCGDTTSCLYSGIYYQQGESRPQGCNECYCNEKQWECTKIECCETNILVIMATFDLDGDYDDIATEKEEFKGELTDSISANFQCPMSMIHNMKLTKGSIRVEFDLIKDANQPSVDIEAIASNMEKKIMDYTFVYDGEVFAVKESSPRFDKLYEEEKEVSQHEEKNMMPLRIGIVATGVGVIVIVIIIIAVVACSRNMKSKHSENENEVEKKVIPTISANACDDTFLKENESVNV